MEENKSIFYYISRLFVTFGVSLFAISIINILVGERAYVFSSLFSLEGEGIATSTILQFMLLSLVITVAQALFLSDLCIKNMSLKLRIALFFATILVTIALFAYLFDWFPLIKVSAWIGFFVSFTICAGVGALLGFLKERTENEKMNSALEKYRQKGEEQSK